METIIPNARSSSIGLVLNQTLVCQYTNRVTSKGIFFKDFPFDYSSPVLMAQLILIFFATRITHFLLTPLRSSTIISQIVAGIVIGPSFITRNKMLWSTLFPPGGKLILDTFASFGFTLHVFLLGVQTDISLFKNLGRKTVVIGVTALIFPLALGGTAYQIIKVFFTSLDIDKASGQGVAASLVQTSMSSFLVTTSLLTDLNILNSELGRLATYSSLMCDSIGWTLSVLGSDTTAAIYTSSINPLLGFLILLIYYFILFFIIRPLVIRMVKHTPEGKPIKEGHFFTILFIVFLAGFAAEVLGQHAGMGTFMLGLSLPDGPPLGSTLVHKLDAISSALILPIFCTISGLKANVQLLIKDIMITELLHLLVYATKLISIFAVSLFLGIPFYEALALALIMCCKGIIDIAQLVGWLDAKVVSDRLFTVLVLNMVIVTGLATPLVAYLYDPSRRYMAYQRRTILHDSNKENDLQILVCIHHQDNVPPIINLLEASNPTKGSPICVFVLQLKELVGRATSILAPHQPSKGQTFDRTNSAHIINAFNHFEKHSEESVVVKHFTAIAPYASMHNDICTIALEKNISITILLFHKKWAIDGTVDNSFSAIRAVNQRVLDKCPCSVGVLIDRGQIGGNQPILISQSNYRIAVLYLGGTDDQEALTYSRRMADHPNVTLKVVWIKRQWRDHNNNNINSSNYYKENLEEESLIDHFKANALENKRISCKEETVKDGAEMTQVIRAMEDDFDLFIVGKHQDPDSPVTLGLTEWSECPELGIIGDMLATSDFQFSVLVVQQPQGASRFLDSPLLSRKDFKSTFFDDSS